jgi:RNA polymerase sigma factor (sigma-70 family)
MDEKRLIAAAQRGDLQSFNQLVRAYEGSLYHTAYRVLGDGSAASDATQDAFIAAYKNIRSFRGGSFRAWLLRIVTNCCYDQLRAKKSRYAVSLDALLLDFPNAEESIGESREASPHDQAELQELGSIIHQGLQTIPLEQRVTLILADIQGFTYEEIAQITGVNIGTVKSRLSRGRAYLREFLLAQEGVLPDSYQFKHATRAMNQGLLQTRLGAISTEGRNLANPEANEMSRLRRPLPQSTPDRLLDVTGACEGS